MARHAITVRLSRLMRRRPWLAPYIAVGAAAVAMTLLAAGLGALMAEVSVLLLFSPLVCAAALIAGARPALFAAIAGLAAAMLLGQFAQANVVLYSALGLAAAFGGGAVRARHVGAADALAQREAHLRSIYDTAPDALIVINQRGLIQSFSAAAERMFGWSAGEVVGQNVNMLMPAPFHGEHDGYLVRYQKTGARGIIGIGRIVVAQRKDGATFPIELSVGEVRSDAGQFFTGFIRDLTERQAVESRLQELQGELVHISRLTAMGEMASALAHELNQPLSAIANYLGGARRLLGQDSDARALEALDKANEQALRAGEVIRRLRDFLARGESERQAESLAKLAQEACALALVGAKDQGVRVTYMFDPAADRVLVDRVPVQQVILNLVRNAIDALEGRISKEIALSSALTEDGKAQVSVADNGPGVDAAAAARLFQPFVTTKAHGMGVGLSISRTIIEAHGGRIWLEDKPGGGAVFKFTLQVARTEG